MVGLNFASEDEAMKFKTAVEGKLQERATRRRGRSLLHFSIHVHVVRS